MNNYKADESLISHRLFLNVKLNFCFHQSVLVAVNVQVSSATKLKSRFSITFGIELHKLNPVVSEIRYCEV